MYWRRPKKSDISFSPEFRQARIFNAFPNIFLFSPAKVVNEAFIFSDSDREQHVRNFFPARYKTAGLKCFLLKTPVLQISYANIFGSSGNVSHVPPLFIKCYFSSETNVPFQMNVSRNVFRYSYNLYSSTF